LHEKSSVNGGVYGGFQIRNPHQKMPPNPQSAPKNTPKSEIRTKNTP